LHIKGKTWHLRRNSVSQCSLATRCAGAKGLIVNDLANGCHSAKPLLELHRNCLGWVPGVLFPAMSQGTGFARGPKPADRRRSQRLPLQVPIFVRGLDEYGDEFLDLTKTLNISAVGACLASPRALRLNQLLFLRIPAPSPSSSGLVSEASPAISARVLREHPVGDIHLGAVEFVKPLA